MLGGDTCSDYMVRGKFQNAYNVMVIAVYVLHVFQELSKFKYLSMPPPFFFGDGGEGLYHYYIL